MNSVSRDQPSHQGSHGTLERFDIDEPIDVRFGRFNGADELTRLFRSLPKAARDGAVLTLVVCLPGDQQALNLGALLDQSAVAQRVVITSLDATTADRWPITFGDLRAEADRRGLKSICVEIDAQRAVIGAMQLLDAGDTFVVLAPSEVGQECFSGWLTQGVRWRGTLSAQDDDGFHHLSE